MKAGFVTCVQLGKSCIEAIHDLGGNFDLFITLEDHRATSKSGRIYLDELSEKTRTPLLKIRHINDQVVVDAIRKYELDWLFIIGWSQIAGADILSAPTKGIIGAHPTLLPEGRGRAAIPWAILKELKKTGVTFFKMDEGVDTGDILDQFEIPLSPDMDATTLYKLVDEAHVKLIRQTWPNLITGQYMLTKQDNEKSSYWEGRTPADGEMTLEMTCREAEKLVRAITRPYPGAYLIQGEKKLIIWKGRIGEHNGLRINFSDGPYTATDYEMI